jgi:hypothetical protein
MGLLLLLGQMSLVEVDLVGMVGTEVEEGRNDGVQMSFRRERINGRGVECVFTIWGASLCLVYGRLGFWYRGFCCLSSPGYGSVFCSLFLYVCISLSLAARMLLFVRSFFIAIYVYVGFFGFLYVISEVGLAGITFARGKIMMGIDTLGSTACRQKLVFHYDISRYDRLFIALYRSHSVKHLSRRH